MSTLVRSVALALAALFGIAIAHKLRVLTRGDSADEPLLARSAVLARYADQVLVTATVIETAVAALLVLRPTWGFAATAVVVLGYAAQIRRLAPEQSCRCFGEVLDAASRGAALARNAAIVAVCVAADALYLSGAVGVASLTPAVLGATLVLLSLPLARVALRTQAAGASTRAGAGRPDLGRVRR